MLRSTLPRFAICAQRIQILSGSTARYLSTSSIPTVFAGSVDPFYNPARNKPWREVSPGFLMKKLQYEEMAKALPRQKLDDFSPGDHIAVKLYAHSPDKPKFKLISGICIARRNRAFDSSFILRTVILDEQVEYHFPLHSPWVAEVKCLKAMHAKRYQQYNLREMENKFFVNIEKWDGVSPTAAELSAKRDERMKRIKAAKMPQARAGKSQEAA